MRAPSANGATVSWHHGETSIRLASTSASGSSGNSISIIARRVSAPSTSTSDRSSTRPDQTGKRGGRHPHRNNEAAPAVFRMSPASGNASATVARRPMGQARERGLQVKERGTRVLLVVVALLLAAMVTQPFVERFFLAQTVPRPVAARGGLSDFERASVEVF